MGILPDSIPIELVNIIRDYLPYTVLHQVCRTSNEHKLTLKKTPTGSAHSIHISIQRFHWRWVSYINHRLLQRRSVPLERDKLTYCNYTRESKFVSYTLRFHDKWTGPPIPFDSFTISNKRVPSGYYIGSQ